MDNKTVTLINKTGSDQTIAGVGLIKNGRSELVPAALAQEFRFYPGWEVPAPAKPATPAPDKETKK